MPDSERGDIRKALRKNFRIYFFIIIFLIVLGFFLFLILVKGWLVKVNPVQTCGDGSLYGTCSLDKPYYCDNGTLTKNASSCGCPTGSTELRGYCFAKYQNDSKISTFEYVLDGKNGTINYTLYGGLANYLYSLPEPIYYVSGGALQRSNITLKIINNQNQYNLLEGLAKDIENLAPNSKVDQARIAISLVQNIPWGASDKKVTLLGATMDYSRYPYQVLYDNEGLCGEKSELLAFLLRDIGYRVALFYYPSQNHEAVGIKCPVQDSLNGTGYCFVETSGPAIISDSKLVYAGGVTLNDSFQLIVLSDGISLPNNLPEYSDAKTLESLQNRIFLDPVSSHVLQNIENKYGLAKVYNIS